MKKVSQEEVLLDFFKIIFACFILFSCALVFSSFNTLVIYSPVFTLVGTVFSGSASVVCYMFYYQNLKVKNLQEWQEIAE